MSPPGSAAVFRTAKLPPGQAVAVIGCGGTGLSAIQGARIAGRDQGDRDRHDVVQARTRSGTRGVGTQIEIHGVELLDEKILTGSNMGSNQFRTDMPRFVEMYLDGRLKLDEMVSKTISLDEVNDGFDDMKQGNVARSVITFR